MWQSDAVVARGPAECCRKSVPGSTAATRKGQRSQDEMADKYKAREPRGAVWRLSLVCIDKRQIEASTAGRLRERRIRIMCQ